jgi:hypothetical protein
LSICTSGNEDEIIDNVEDDPALFRCWFTINGVGEDGYGCVRCVDVVDDDIRLVDVFCCCSLRFFKVSFSSCIRLSLALKGVETAACLETL